MTTNNVSSSSSSGGIGFVGLLTIVFIVLKLTGVIDWSWVWVLAPLWIGFVVGLVILLLVFGIGYFVISHKDKKERERKAQRKFY